MGQVEGVPVNQNLTVFTSLPGDDMELFKCRYDFKYFR